MSETTQSHELDALILDLAEWVGKSPRTYEDVMEAWRTSCPRLTVWEDAVERGIVERVRAADGRLMVAVTADGLRFLAENGRGVPIGARCGGRRRAEEETSVAGGKAGS